MSDDSGLAAAVETTAAQKVKNTHIIDMLVERGLKSGMIIEMTVPKGTIFDNGMDGPAGSADPQGFTQKRYKNELTDYSPTAQQVFNTQRKVSGYVRGIEPDRIFFTSTWNMEYDNFSMHAMSPWYVTNDSIMDFSWQGMPKTGRERMHLIRDAIEIMAAGIEYWLSPKDFAVKHWGHVPEAMRAREKIVPYRLDD